MEKEISTQELGVSSQDLLAGNFPSSDSPTTKKRIDWTLMQLEYYRLSYGDVMEDDVARLFQFCENLLMNVWNVANEKLKKEDCQKVNEAREIFLQKYRQECRKILIRKRNMVAFRPKNLPFSNDVVEALKFYELSLRHIIERVF